EFIAEIDILRTLDKEFSDVEILIFGDKNYNSFAKLVNDIWKKNIQEQGLDATTLVSDLFSDNKIFKIGYAQNYDKINCESSVKSSFAKAGNLTVDVNEPVGVESIASGGNHTFYTQRCSMSS